MHDMKKSNGFTYWKRPWHKWLILATAVLQLLCLWMNIREYHNVSAAGILSVSEWASYAAQKNFQCALNGMMAACFLGIFLIGILAHSQKVARPAEGILLLLLAFAWGVTGLALRLFSLSGKGLFGVLILILALGGAAYDLLKYRKK